MMDLLTPCYLEVVEKKYKIPVGTWMTDNKSKELGRWNLLFLTTGLEGMQLWMLKAVLGVSHVKSPILHIVAKTMITY
jgi:hypothetical protein